jgi:hypothetical protein
MAHMLRVEVSTLALHPLQNTPDKGHTGSCLNYTNELVSFLSGKDYNHMPVTVLLEGAKKKLIDTGNR